MLPVSIEQKGVFAEKEEKKRRNFENPLVANPLIPQGRKLRLSKVKWLIQSHIAKMCPLFLLAWSLHFLGKNKKQCREALDTGPYTHRCSANICWMNSWADAILYFSVSVHIVTCNKNTLLFFLRKNSFHLWKQFFSTPTIFPDTHVIYVHTYHLCNCISALLKNILSSDSFLDTFCSTAGIYACRTLVLKHFLSSPA